MSYPTKQSREKCWTARDHYWQCLDREDEKRCELLRKQYEVECPQTWVKHFDRKRDYLKFQEKLEKEGPEAIKQS